MGYYSYFRDINNNLYQVLLMDSKGEAGIKDELILGGTPFETSMKADGKHLYSPILTTGATLRILTKELPFDLYTSNPRGIKIQVSRMSDSKKMYCGFVTPCAYSQGFDNETEEIELECVDGIAVLKDLKYYGQHTVATFSEIIFKCLNMSGLYKNLYVVDNLMTLGLDSPVITGKGAEIKSFRISQQNFYAEKDDINQTDDDVAWSAYDVLFEICQWLNLTLYAEGEDVYLINFDAIKQGINNYFKYDLTKSPEQDGEYVTLSETRHIIGESYAENGTQIELTEVFNKVTVVDDFNAFESLFPEFGDDATETNITADSDSILRTLCQNQTNGFREGDTFKTTTGGGNYQIFIQRGWEDNYWVVVVRFYDSQIFDFKHYTTDASHSIDNTPVNCWGKFMNMYGASYVRLYKKYFSQKDYNSWRANYASNWWSQGDNTRRQAWVDLLNGVEPENVNFKPMIIFRNGDSNHIGPTAYKRTGKYDKVWDKYLSSPSSSNQEDCQRYPFVTMKGETANAIFSNVNSYLCLEGSYSQHDKEVQSYPLADGQWNKELKREPDYKWNDELFFWARLKWGDMYYTNDGWKNTPSDFQIYWKGKGSQDGDKTRVRDYFDKTFQFGNVADVDFATSGKGVYIKSPQSGNLSGGAEFTIYCPRDSFGRSNHNAWKDANRYSRYYNRVQTLSGLKLTTKVIANELDEGDMLGDTCYTNVISNEAVSEMDEIKFKVCTSDNKSPSYSIVDHLLAISQNGTINYESKSVDKVLNKALFKGGKVLNQGLRQEENLVVALTEQYKEPRVVFDCNLKWIEHKIYCLFTDKTLVGRHFVISEMNRDFKMARANLRLIEKA